MSIKKLAIICLLSIYLADFTISFMDHENNNDILGFLNGLSENSLKKVNEIKNIWLDSYITNLEFPPVIRMYSKSKKEYINNIMQYVYDNIKKFPNLKAFKELVLKWSEYHDNAYKKEHIPPISLNFK